MKALQPCVATAGTVWGFEGRPNWGVPGSGAASSSMAGCQAVRSSGQFNASCTTKEVGGRTESCLEAQLRGLGGLPSKAEREWPPR